MRDNVIVLPIARATHAALLCVLFESCKRAVRLGVMRDSDCERVLCDATERDCGTVRAAYEIILSACESRVRP